MKKLKKYKLKNNKKIGKYLKKKKFKKNPTKFKKKK